MLVVEDNGRGMSRKVLLDYLRLCDTTSRMPAFPRGEVHSKCCTVLAHW